MPKLPIYEQQTSPSFIPTTRATDARLIDNRGAALQNVAAAVGQAGETYGRVEMQKEQERIRQEQEDARVWTMQTMSDATLKMMQSLADMQSSAESGAPNFTSKYMESFSEYEQTLFSIAPNDSSKKFLSERMLALRTSLGAQAATFEGQERAKWRISTVDQSIKNTADAVAMDSSRATVVLAEQRAVIDAMDIPPEQKRALTEKLVNDVSTAAVIGEIDRDPNTSLAKLSARLGVTVQEVKAESLPVTTEQEVNAKYDALEGSFGFTPTSKKRSKEENERVGGVADSQHMAGTARDWSVKGKSPQEVAQFVRALQSEGFEVITKTHGTGPHIHAELPPRGRAKKKIEEAKEPVAIDDPIYNMLTVPQVVALMGRAETAMGKQQSQMRSLIAAREADELAQYQDGKVPDATLSLDEMIAAYGGVEGARRFQALQSGKDYAQKMSALVTQTPEQIKQTLENSAPKDAAGYAIKQPQFENYARAAGAVLNARNSDPVQFAINHFDEQPLNFSDQNELAAGFKRRVGVAQTNSQKFGTPFRLLSDAEKSQMSGMFKQMTHIEQAEFLGTISGSIPDPVSYQAIMSEFVKDAPLVAHAGSLMRVKEMGLIGDIPRLVTSTTAKDTAMKVLYGGSLLKPADGRPSPVNMPKDADLRRHWNEYVGQAYAGSPAASGMTYESYKAYVAATLAERGIDGSVYNREMKEILDSALPAVTGGVYEVNNSRIVAPYGVGEDTVLNTLESQFQQSSQRVPFSTVNLTTVANGIYSVNVGLGAFPAPNTPAVDTYTLGGMVFDVLPGGALRSRQNGQLFLRVQPTGIPRR